MKIKAMDETQCYRSLIQDEALRLRHRLLATLFFFQSFIQIPPYLHICYDKNYLSFLCRSLNISINRRSFMFYHFHLFSGSITILSLLFGAFFSSFFGFGVSCVDIFCWDIIMSSYKVEKLEFGGGGRNEDFIIFLSIRSPLLLYEGGILEN
ncbi:uncharacterized protein TrAFT101_007901 [Trichoderma asperellum]|uniref:uncharacterized protein n=1 Tax=Trichoderma asperellum TaxID=101201 RepID=UPI00332FBE7C|nr:hypothetical protein TrAFT101_007901 [Trichoderma asperellum]